MRKINLLLIFTATIFIQTAAWSYPELTRHGYASCSACHVSPSGGGLTTAYGRSLSKELLSHWGAEGEESFLYKVTPPDWLSVGGDVRTIQTYVDTPNFKQQKFFVMQSDLEIAVKYKKLYADATAGSQDGPEGTPDRGHFLSRRHYLGYQFTDEVSLRAGRFYPAFGINMPNHSIYTRKDLAFDEGYETDNVEASYSGEKYDLFVTGILGRTDDYESDWQRGAAISASYFFLDRFKIGLSYLHSTLQTSARDLASVFGILGFSKNLYLLSETDFQWLRDTTGTGSSPHGAVTYQQLNYEFSQGFHLYLVEEISYLDYNEILTRKDSYGAGTQLFPRPHFDIEIEYRKERNMGQYAKYYDTGWMMLHYYL